VAFSRIVSEIEVVGVANTNTGQRFDGLVLQERDLNLRPQQMKIVYSNLAQLSLLAVSATREAAPGLHRGQKVCPTRAIF